MPECPLVGKDETIVKMNGAVGGLCQLLIVGHDDEGLAKAVAEVEEQLVQLGLVL